MHGLMKENIQLNRKVLSELSMHEPYSFKALVDISRKTFPGNKNVAFPPKKEGISIGLWLTSWAAPSWEENGLILRYLVINFCSNKACSDEIY